MAYEQVSFPTFALGLNLRDKVDAINEGEAIDLLNVRFTARGAVEQRDGYAQLTGTALTNPVKSLEPFYRTSGANQIVAGCGTRLEAIGIDGAIVASGSVTGLTDGIWDFARFGAPGNEYIYAGNGSDLLQRWSGTAWAGGSGVASTPKAGALAVMAVDQGNRMVAGRFNGTTGGPTGGASTSNPSRVYFSDPGAPETWGTNNYVDLTPGDGEKVQGIIAWRDSVFVFKETKFFVFYGTSVDVAGTPIFNYTTVDANAGLVSPRALCANESGVYFMDRRGVYRTTGGEPTLLSSAIDPFFLGGASSFYLGGVLTHAQITNSAMWTHEQRIYLGVTTSGTTNNRVLVYDPRFEWWSLYDFPAACGASFRISDQAELVFGATSANEIMRHSSAYTSDDGTAITSRWRSGWFDYGLSGVKTIRESKAWGLSGTVSMGISADFDESTGTLDQIDFSDPSTAFWGASTWGGTFWGTSPGLIGKMRRRAVQGTVFSTYFTNNVLSERWAVHRLTHHLRETRIPSVVSA